MAHDKRRLPPELREMREGAEHRPPNEIWLAWTADIESHLGRKCCGARTRGGWPCPVSPIKERTRCKKHGGYTLRGPSHPNFKHGLSGRTIRMARELPKETRKAFLDSLADDNLLELRAEIALCDQQLVSLLQRSRAGATMSAWSKIDWIRGEMVVAMSQRKAEKVAELMEEWRKIMIEPGDGPDLRAEIRKTLDLRRKLVRGEQVRLEALQGYITNERMLAFINRIIEVLTKSVPREFLGEPIQELEKYLMLPSGGGPSADEDSEYELVE